MFAGNEKIWIIADTHWLHRNIKTYCDRPADHTELILYNWHRLVHPTDYIIHLGDVGHVRKEFRDVVFSDLPGKKFLIRGNHDRGLRRWKKVGFSILGKRVLLGLYNHLIILSHKPINELDAWTGIINVHGHRHNRSCDELWKINASVELQNYAPVRLGDLVKSRLDLIKALYDEVGV